jgi:uncharacterized membrane protein HdeD (DUF308 family)
LGTFFGILIIIQGLVFIILSFSPKGKNNVSPAINFLLGTFFVVLGSMIIDS